MRSFEGVKGSGATVARVRSTAYCNTSVTGTRSVLSEAPHMSNSGHGVVQLARPRRVPAHRHVESGLARLAGRTAWLALPVLEALRQERRQWNLGGRGCYCTKCDAGLEYLRIARQARWRRPVRSAALCRVPGCRSQGDRGECRIVCEEGFATRQTAGFGRAAGCCRFLLCRATHRSGPVTP